MENLKEEYDKLLEDYNYILNLLKEKNDEIANLESIIDNLLIEKEKNGK